MESQKRHLCLQLEDARSDTEDESQDEEDDENVKNEYNKIFNNSNN